jgi:hypothetical protein
MQIIEQIKSYHFNKSFLAICAIRYTLLISIWGILEPLNIVREGSIDLITVIIAFVVILIGDVVFSQLLSTNLSLTNLQKTTFENTNNIPLYIAKNTTKILFIDDEKPNISENLKNNGYNIQMIDKIGKFNAINKINPQIIFLDIIGVGTADYKETDGIGILEDLKKYRPDIMVIIYSSVGQVPGTRSYNILKESSDGEFNKQSVILEHETEINKRIEELYSKKRIIKTIKRTLPHIVETTFSETPIDDLISTLEVEKWPSQELKNSIMTILKLMKAFS